MTSAGQAASARRPRSYVVALGALAVGAGLLFLVSGRTWATVLAASPGLPTVTAGVTGGDVTPGKELAVVALAGIAGLVALRRAGRIVAGAVLVLGSLGVMVRDVQFATSYSRAPGVGEQIAADVSERIGVGVTAAQVSGSAWWALEIVGAALVLVGGVLAVVSSRGWPAMGRRYERDAGSTPAPSEATASTGTAGVWDALDRGEDPTADPET